MLRYGTLAAAVALAGCATVPPEEDPVYLKLTDLEARLMRIERVIDNQSILELANRLDQLQSQGQSLRGEVETLQFESEQGASSQRELYMDLDRRLQALENRLSGGGAGAGAGLGGAGGGTTLAAATGGNERASYQAAFDMLKEGRYGESAGAFQQFLTGFPGSELADNAQYWLAETFYVQREFAKALPEFEKVVATYPESSKLPDALLKIGYCNYELDRFDAARDALTQVRDQYRGTTAARLADQRLERMSSESG